MFGLRKVLWRKNISLFARVNSDGHYQFVSVPTVFNMFSKTDKKKKRREGGKEWMTSW